MGFRGKNHYVPELYLKRFQEDSGRICVYRLLVPHPRVPVWKRSTAGGVGYYRHLYTRLVAGVESDEIEEWFNRDFESPAEEALHKATSNLRLSEKDWYRLVRFLAAQDVRTPARLLEDLSRWNKEALPTLQECLADLPKSREEMRTKLAERKRLPNTEYLPIRVKTEIVPGQEFGRVRAELVVGRGLWLFSLKHALENTAKILHTHKWSILRPPDGMSWFTSDKPVVRLNFHHEGKYDFEGGWGSKGTEILFPLSPRHLLYTQVGHRVPVRGSVMPSAHMVRRMIAEHAHRLIFSATEDAEVPTMRPRVESAEAFQNEKMQWDRWNEDQVAAERELLGENNR